MNDDNEEVRCPCCGRAVSKAQLRSSIGQMERWRLTDRKRFVLDEKEHEKIADLIDWYDAAIWAMELVVGPDPGTRNEEGEE